MSKLSTLDEICQTRPTLGRHLATFVLCLQIYNITRAEIAKIMATNCQNLRNFEFRAEQKCANLVDLSKTAEWAPAKTGFDTTEYEPSTITFLYFDIAQISKSKYNIFKSLFHSLGTGRRRNAGAARSSCTTRRWSLWAAGPRAAACRRTASRRSCRSACWR